MPPRAFRILTYDSLGRAAEPPPATFCSRAGGRCVRIGDSHDIQRITYTYDVDGNRVMKANTSTGTLYWYMAPGIVAESDLTGTLKSEYVFFGGERVARRDLAAPAGVFYYFSDHLKTASVITDANGNIKAESDYYPWGGELQFVANDSNHYKFTGKERDTETGLDYFGARYYSNTLGRFISADWSATPIPVPYADFSDPQSLNLYTYVRNLPTTRADLDGHEGGLLVDLQGIAELVEEGAATGARLVATATAATTASVVTVIVTTGTVVYHSVQTSKAVLSLNAADKELALATDRRNQDLIRRKAEQEQSQAEEKKPEPQPQTSAAGGQRGSGGGRKLGSSGKPIIHNVDHSTKKGAKDAARNGGNTKPMHHPSPKVGKPHYHSTVDGDKKHDGVHHNYPE